MSIAAHNQKKFQAVKKLQLPTHEYIVTGSGPMGAKNLKKIGDIDLLVSNKLWAELSQEYQVVDNNGISTIDIPGTDIEILCEESFSNLNQTGNPTAADRGRLEEPPNRQKC